jgi:hypothetical protein
VANTHTKTFWLCPNNHQWQTTYRSFQSGNRCTLCIRQWSKKPEDYHSLAKSNGLEWLGPEVRNTQSKTFWLCSNGHKWESTYNVVQQRGRCGQCRKKITEEDYRDLAEKQGFEWLGFHVTSHKKTVWRCSKNHEWAAPYFRVKQGHGCPHCAKCAPKTTIDYYNLAFDLNIIWLGPEVGSTHTYTNWQSIECGHEWKHTYHSLSQRKASYGCPVCKESSGERHVAKILKSLGILFVKQKTFDGCKDKGHLRFDFYFVFANARFLVEYQGMQHYEPVKYWGGEKTLRVIQRRDRIKSDFAAANGLHLIIIPYTHYDRIGTIIIDRLTQVTGESPLTFVDRIGAARGSVGPLEGIQLSLGLERG